MAILRSLSKRHSGRIPCKLSLCGRISNCAMTAGVIAERPIGFGLLSFTGLPQGVLIDAAGRVEKKSVGDELVKQWLECLD